MLEAEENAGVKCDSASLFFVVTVYGRDTWQLAENFSYTFKVGENKI